ncbi:5643_t:CDS:2, partial [Gigaspora margarita]
MSNSISTSRFTCSLCTRSQSYKTQHGLKYHETIKHKDYNILPLYILPLPNYELEHIKKVMIQEIQKYLKKHHRTIGNQREQNYGNSQLSWVKLVDETNYNLQTELYIEWAMKGFHDTS